MPKAKNPRKARFLAALRIAGLTMEEWAESEGSTQGYVSNLLSGRRTSDALNRRIDAFAERHLAKAVT